MTSCCGSIVLDEKLNFDNGSFKASASIMSGRSGFYSSIQTHPRVLFGSYPTREGMRVLQDIGVRYIVDLTTPSEKTRLEPYNAKEYDMTYIHFPIKDNFVPYDMESFNEFIMWLIHIIQALKENEHVYIHCKGGHGRSGMIVCCVLCIMFGLTPSQSIQEVTHGHRQRPDIGAKWKMRLCPSNEIQRIFVDRVFQSNHCIQNQRSSGQDIEHVFNSLRRRMLLSHREQK